MVTVLEPHQYPRLRPLFGDLPAYNLILDAALDGSSPAWIAADNAETPTGAFLATAEGYFLVGDASNAAWIADLKAFFHRAMHETGYWRGSPVLYLNFSSPAWIPRLSELFPGREPFRVERHHYVCTQSKYTGKPASGFTVERITESLLARPALAVPHHIPQWMESNWGSRAAFMARGFGFCTLHENKVVSWSLADCISGPRCEIGIQTDEEYRHRGLASLTAAAAVDYALSCGLTEVGWHCNVDNLGSIGTALKVGFTKERDYVHTCIPLFAD